jgi:heme/copper-type cytochrome/quinol oxidase subunit 2
MVMLGALVCACEDPDPWIAQLEPPPVRAVEIDILARRDGCEFTHGINSDRELVVPIDTPLRFVFTSKDEDHDVDFGNPSIRQHVVRYSYRYLALRMDRAGPFALACPADVPAKLTAVSVNDYASYLNRLRAADPY